VLAGTNLGIALLWSKLDMTAREHVARRWRSPWLSRRVSMPLGTALRLERAMSDGSIRVHRGARAIERDGQRLRVVHERGTIDGDWVIGCMGPGSGEELLRHPLCRQMLAEGVAGLEPAGGLAVEPSSCRLLDSRGDAHANIHCVGGLTRGAFFMTAAVDVIADQASRVARSRQTEPVRPMRAIA